MPRSMMAVTKTSRRLTWHWARPQQVCCCLLVVDATRRTCGDATSYDRFKQGLGWGLRSSMSACQLWHQVGAWSNVLHRRSVRFASMRRCASRLSHFALPFT